MSTLKKIALIGGIIGLFIAGVAEANTVYNAPALFETSLATAITANATSATLSYGVLRDGTILNGPVCFTIDSGLSTTEFVCGNASGTVITNLIRGMGEDGSSTYPAISYPHRYGADVKVTDFPVLQQLLNFVQGLFSFPNVLSYSGLSTSTIGANGNNIASVGYVNSVAVSGAPNASVSVKGISQLSTQAQMAAHTALGSTGASLVDQTANDSLVASTSPVGVVASGTLDPSFLLNGNYSLGSTTAQSLVSNSSTLNGNVIIGSSTNAILRTSATGLVSGVGNATTGSLLTFGNNGWQAGLVQSMQTATATVSTTLSAIQTVSLPSASTGTYYQIGFQEAATGGTKINSSTVLLNGTALFTCTGNSNNDEPLSFEMQMWMQNSTSSEIIFFPFQTIPFGSSGCTGASSGGFNSIVVTSTPSLVIQQRALVANTETVNSTATIMYFQ